MATAYFKIPLSVESKGGTARVVPPKELKKFNYQFVIVKEEGTEGIIKINTSSDDLKKIENIKKCEKLSKKQMEQIIIINYPEPILKQKYRSEVDSEGNRICDTFQIVRSGYYLIDIPVCSHS